MELESGVGGGWSQGSRIPHSLGRLKRMDFPFIRHSDKKTYPSTPTPDSRPQTPEPGLQTPDPRLQTLDPVMKGKRLKKLGWPQGPIIGKGVELAKRLARRGMTEEDILHRLEKIRANPQAISEDDEGYALAKEALKLLVPDETAVREKPLDAPIWGKHLIDDGAIAQLNRAMQLPVTVAGALMPDAHVGYGIPIGGVVALENAVAPYMVGVDIACRMMLSVYPHEMIDFLEEGKRREKITETIQKETRFGIGAAFEEGQRRSHAVLDENTWESTPLLRKLKAKAWAQLGTSGTGNHFVDVGLIRITDIGQRLLDLPGDTFLGILTHSGSRGMGATVASHYSKLAREVTPLPKGFEALAWLSLDDEAGQEYWMSMNLAGRYASACHHTIHQAIAGRLHEEPLLQIENHHNFAWKENWKGNDVIVHRKGATPAHEGVLGIIPGSQGHPSYVVRGLGSEPSINSASHGAGRVMSRKKAIASIPRRDRDAWLLDKGVELLAGGMDEAPQAYKDIREVMALQTDLVEPLATFHPRIVLMASDGKSEG